ncbi:hypothetical protein [Gordonia terrae]|uniref:Uncharacterized protein n=1 Tax=Gordonia terrae NBRC 100016 TaxID=1089454 RepID=A0ABQ0HLI1_9ACTN|nr:hypothetical protein [Gordonia terrae]GAB46746.1 hypothetical protein GOTRE_181_00260 [Gordonia terrae NBRC 100016]VTR10800.1 Uncharacterised protein [Clostridioides difficile]
MNIYIRVNSGGDLTFVDVDNLHQLFVETEVAVQVTIEILEEHGLACRSEMPGHVELVLAELYRRASALAEYTGWSEKWSQMINYASREGWMSGDGTTVRAHIDTTA